MTRFFDIDEWLVLLVIALVIVGIAGCASPDDLRIVQPATWHELDRTDLAVMCRDVDPGLKGCVVSGTEGDHIYLLKHDGR